MKQIYQAVALSLSLTLVAGAANAQSKFPDRPISLVVGFPAGGGQDVWARQIASSMSKTLGQQVVVQNKVGASGSIGLAYVATSKPDGYTLAALQASALLLAPLTMKVDYKVGDFDYLAGAADQPYCLCVSGKSSIKTFNELLAYEKANPGKLSWGHLGTGHATYVFADAAFRHFNVRPVGVTYKGDAETIPAVLGGHIDVASTASTFVAQAKAGELRPLAIYASKRMAEFPDIPTVNELGVPIDPRLASFIGFAAPKGLPPDVKAKLEHAFQVAITSKEFETLIGRSAATVVYRNGETFGKEAEVLYKMLQDFPKPTAQ